MLFARLINLIEAHAESLTREVLEDMAANPRTPHFHGLAPEDMEERIFRLYRDLGKWIGTQQESNIEAEYVELGRRRSQEGVRLSELIYVVILCKKHLRNYIQRHGLIEPAGVVDHPDVLPVHMHGIQELNYMVGTFFDRALYYTARGYESRSGRKPVADGR